MNLKHQIEEMEDEVHLGNETIIIKESEVGRCFLLCALCMGLSFIATVVKHFELVEFLTHW
jgi:hypothetical protein